jgi:hypothetical protein
MCCNKSPRWKEQRGGWVAKVCAAGNENQSEKHAVWAEKNEICARNFGSLPSMSSREQWSRRFEENAEKLSESSRDLMD